jgi:hypothetical protein
MGANTFITASSGTTVKKAFASARREALYNYGHSGYTGSIAEKDSFVMCSSETFSSYDEAEKFADKLIDDGDERVDDKWGPAGCVKFLDKDGNTEYLFFGWASS